MEGRKADLVWDLARDLVGPHWVLRCGLLVAEVGPDKHQRRGDAKPEEAQGEQRAEGHCAAALLAPHQDVEPDEDGEEHAREQQRCLQRCLLPLIALHIQLTPLSQSCLLLSLRVHRSLGIFLIVPPFKALSAVTQS